MHNYVHSASAFERQWQEREGGGGGGWGGVVLIVSHEKQCNIDALVAINKKQI